MLRFRHPARAPLSSQTPANDNPQPPAGAPAWPRPKFPKDEVGFLAELRRRVDSYFVDGDRRERGRGSDWRKWVKRELRFCVS